jgi:tetratricopeptide (TPR) repeat protein
MTASDPASEPGALRAHVRRAAELVNERRLPEAERELLAATALEARDLRSRKLLGLVRFQLGRLGEAEAGLREVADEAPDDAAVHLCLGLIALKLERFAEARAALGRVAVLRPDDRRALAYLGYAHARLGEAAQAAAAFRRAGQELLAAEVEGRSPSGDTRGELGPGAAPLAELRDEFSGARTAVTHVEAGTPGPHAGRRPRPRVGASAGAPIRATNVPPREEASFAAPSLTRSGGALSLDAFALERLVADDQAAPLSSWRADGLALAVREELHARADVLAVVEGELRIEPARRRTRGRLTSDPLGGATAPFSRCVGAGDVWLAPTAPDQALLALVLEDDVLYLREDLVAAFTGELAWEAGCVPRASLDLLQFRGSGRVVIAVTGRDVLAVRTAEARSLRIDRARLIGWIGRVVARGVCDVEATPSTHVACEGEGVLLLARHGQPGQGAHQRP